MGLFDIIFLTLAHALVIRKNITCVTQTYVMDGLVNPPVVVNETDLLIFDLQSGCDSHPFEIRDAGGVAVSGVTGQLATSGEITWNITAGLAGLFSYICVNHPSMTNTITVIGPVKADAPTALQAIPQTTTTAYLQWAAGVQGLGECDFQSWAVLYASPSPVPGAVQGCTGLLAPNTLSCNATGLDSTASYAFSVQMVCNNAGANSAVVSSSSFKVAPAATLSNVAGLAKTATSVLLSWARGAFVGVLNGACDLAYFEVRTVSPVSAAVEGCASVGTTLGCLATNLSASTSYTFSVREVCTNSAFNSVAKNSNIVTTKTGVNVNVTCAGPSAFLVNGVANGNVSAFRGSTVFFNLYGCTIYPFTIATGNSQGVTNNNANGGTVQLDTNVTTPAVLRYSCLTSPTMTGLILVNNPPVKASTPGRPSVSTQQGLPDLSISWTANGAGDCVFANWLVQVDGVSGDVAGCTTFANASMTSCVATNLNGSTSYSFTVQRICTDPMANSAISSASNPRTTMSTAGVKICQMTDTCNCGNASICTCQLTKVCNCENADQCICQGGVCNGGHANQLICNFPTNCNKQCAKSCPLCISIVTDFFGSGSKSSSCDSSSAEAIAASGVVLLVASFLVL